ncbi:hypothetical protein Q8A73_016682 [Channa argus]|nr:hypothetical protein Q8A73_016677 [Channa argus]KAK2894198.1 hypothetical protein Q8A73_016682 [Channa argus]
MNLTTLYRSNIEEARTATDGANEYLAVLGALNVNIRDLAGRDVVVALAAKFYLEGRLEAALKQFLQGLSCLGLLDEVKKHPHLFRSVFTKNLNPLIAAKISKLFQPSFAQSGTNLRRTQAKAYGFFRDWLLDIEWIPTTPQTYEEFKEWMVSGIIQAPQFSTA